MSKRKVTKLRPKKGTEQPATIAAIVRGLVELYGSQRNFAKEFKISESRAGKLMKEGRDNLTLYNLLNLARLSGHDPFVVLEAAGKDDASKLLRELFPDAKVKSAMSTQDREIITKWNQLPPRVKELMRGFTETSDQHANTGS